MSDLQAVVMRDLDEEVNFTMEHVEILRHTQKNGLFCGGSKEMDLLVERGYMAEARRKSFVPDMYYSITLKGKAILNAKVGNQLGIQSTEKP